jgi:HK97 family phage major capsid protein
MMKTYLMQNKTKLLSALTLCLGAVFGLIDPAMAAVGGLVLDVEPESFKQLNEAWKKAIDGVNENIKKVQDAANDALEEVRKEGTLHAKTNEELTKLGEAGNALSIDLKAVQDRILEAEQKLAKRPSGEGGGEVKSIGQLVIESDEFKAASLSAGKGKINMEGVNIGSFHKTQIVNATGLSQPLVPTDRLDGVVMPMQRRLTIRNLLPNNRTNSNMIAFASETLFTNAAGAQGGPTSPIGNGEGELKQESALTFQLNNTPVCLIAHFIPASRQILSDAPMLQGYIDGRLRYGVALKEETDLLTGDGGAGTLNGLINQSAAFSGGATNQTILDTLLKSMLQVSLQNMQATGVIMHPTDWTDLQLLKTTYGEYLFSDPHGVQAPRVWGMDVVATASMTQGKFLTGAFTLAAELFDRDDATVRVAEQHADFFVRNMVAILAEERLALAVYRSAALVYGSVSYAG